MPSDDEPQGEWIDLDAVLAMHKRHRYDHGIFRREMFGEWPPNKKQCEMHTKFDRCTNEARFKVKTEDSESDAHVCDRCIVPWMMSIRSGVTILVVKL